MHVGNIFILTEELDLNDTAQAAQLQRELHRIQELRDKQTKPQVQFNFGNLNHKGL